MSNETIAWKICYTDNGQYRTVLSEHNSVGDYRAIDPMASSIALCAAPVSAEPVLRIGTDRNGELAIFTPRFNSVIARFTPCGKSGMNEGLLYTAPVAAKPDVTQQTLDDVKAGIPARDAEIEALRREIEALQAQQDANKVDAALAEMVHAMFRSANSIPVTRITIDRKQYKAAIGAARKEQA